MNSLQKITGIILAGGKSSRMGTDKGLLEWNGSPFIRNIINALQPLVCDIIIISNSEEYKRFGFSVYPDIIQEHGPLGGIYTGLIHSETNDNLVISCDVPLIETQILQKLVEQNDRNTDIVQLSYKTETMPLIALYKKSCEKIFLDRLQQKKLKLRVAVSEMRVKTIPLTSEEAVYAENVNTQEGLKQLRNANNG